MYMEACIHASVCVCVRERDVMDTTTRFQILDVSVCANSFVGKSMNSILPPARRKMLAQNGLFSVDIAKDKKE